MFLFGHLCSLNWVFVFIFLRCNHDFSNKILLLLLLEVESLIKGIDLLKSSSMDGLPTKVLKEAFVVISRQLTYMFNKSLESDLQGGYRKNFSTIHTISELLMK